jgi:hypothetical protein
MTARLKDFSPRNFVPDIPLDQLPPAQLTLLERVWLIVLMGYLLIAPAWSWRALSC